MSKAELPPSDAELTLLEAWVAADPGSRLYLRLGQAYLGAGRLEEAAAVLRRGLTVHPEDLAGRQFLAQALLDLGRSDEALGELLEADRALRDFAGLYTALAGLHQSLGQDAQARRAGELARLLGEVLPADPGASDEPSLQPSLFQAPATATLARIYAAQGLTQQAEEVYRRLGQGNQDAPTQPELPPEPASQAEPAPQAEPAQAPALPPRPGQGMLLKRLGALQAAAKKRQPGRAAI